jgi:hypothetical protein
MNHLTSDELIDAVEGVLAPERREHLKVCPDCAREVAALAAVLKEARGVDVPEPSPLFWSHFSERVRSAIQSDRPGGSNWNAWPKLLFAPAAALALVVIGILAVMPKTTAPPTARTASTRDIGLPDDGWTIVADLVGDIDLESAAAEGLSIRPGTAELAALELTADEQRELGRLLRAELDRVKS